MATDIAEPGVAYVLEEMPGKPHTEENNCTYAKIHTENQLQGEGYSYIVPFLGHRIRERIEFRTWNAVWDKPIPDHAKPMGNRSIVGRGECRIFFNDLQVYGFLFDGDTRDAMLKAIGCVRELRSFPVPLTSRDSIYGMVGQRAWFEERSCEILRVIVETGQLEIETTEPKGDGVISVRRRVDLLSPFLRVRTLDVDNTS